MAIPEHANITVADPSKTAQMLSTLFDWRIRWEGESIFEGRSVHVGDETSYLALYAPPKPISNDDPMGEESYYSRGGLNHIGVVVDDVDEVRDRAVALGYTPGEWHDYEPGRRFYLTEENGIEIEVISYA